ncbi:MAG: aminotransferase class I/II-fold pyridoxal phosphate-dependent enzyme, partial [Eubacteriales bacterium]|nr:aminotransferase class I/II-fold pyridoxal phosphate-dependent enzyme [Eubacteriales bacterium]
YKEACAEDLHLDLSRGKPNREQLELSMDMFDILNSKSTLDTADGTDCRNYGVLTGIPEAKTLLGDIMNTNPKNVIVGGNSSLTIMYDIITHGMLDGIMGEKPWSQIPDRKFLCVVPGYDRHFNMTEHFGFQLISIPMLEDGPDMDQIREWVEKDPTVKGIWCVPRYSNPTGTVYSREVIEEFANLKPAAQDFRIFWDNAYVVHVLYSSESSQYPDILEIAEKAGNPDIVYEFCSTSKMSFPGGGIAGVAASPANRIDIESFLKYAMICTDKINQIRQARYFSSHNKIRRHMLKEASILRPKFEITEKMLEEGLDGLGIGDWTCPKGGYFISFNTLPGLADRVVELCHNAGVKLTGAGATFPYGKDPENRNIRIAPSFAELTEIKTAMHLLTVAVRIASLESMDEDKAD